MSAEVKPAPVVTTEDGAVLGINWRELVESGQIR